MMTRAILLSVLQGHGNQEDDPVEMVMGYSCSSDNKQVNKTAVGVG